MCDFCVALALPPPGGIRNLSHETGVTFALSYVSGIETAIAFAGEKRAILIQLSGAEVPPVSFGRAKESAVVLVVSLSDCELTGSGTAAAKPMRAAVVHAVRS